MGVGVFSFLRVDSAPSTPILDWRCVLCIMFISVLCCVCSARNGGGKGKARLRRAPPIVDRG